MWHSYFHRIENKYSMRIGLKKTLVIRIDGKDITKSKTISFIDKKANSFLDCFERTIKTITEKYNCLCFFGTDEANFIFEEPEGFLDQLNIDKERNCRTNEIVSLFTQMFFDCFNDIYNRSEKVFWHGVCFSIEKEKLNSYIKFRLSILKNVATAYLLKRMMVNDAGRIKMDERVALNEKFKTYDKVKELEKGTLYLNGNRIDVEEFLNGNIEIIKVDNEKIEDDYFDITKWDI